MCGILGATADVRCHIGAIRGNKLTGGMDEAGLVDGVAFASDGCGGTAAGAAGGHRSLVFDASLVHGCLV